MGGVRPDPPETYGCVGRVKNEMLEGSRSSLFAAGCSRLPKIERLLELRDTIRWIAVYVRSEEAQYLPAFGLEVVRLSCVVNALAETGMKLRIDPMNHRYPISQT